jgi:hypothetical protein
LERDVQEELHEEIRASAGEIAEAVDAESDFKGREYHAEIQATPTRTLAAVDQAAEMWDAAWEAAPYGGRLHMPALAGIRGGSILLRVEATRSDAGTDLVLKVEDSAYRINRGAALFLLVGALGGISAVFWPLFPERLLPFVPLGLVMAIGAWLLIVSRLRSAGPQDFLDTVAELAEEDGKPTGEEFGSDPLEP